MTDREMTREIDTTGETRLLMNLLFAETTRIDDAVDRERGSGGASDLRVP